MHELKLTIYFWPDPYHQRIYMSHIGFRLEDASDHSEFHYHSWDRCTLGAEPHDFDEDARILGRPEQVSFRLQVEDTVSVTTLREQHESLGFLPFGTIQPEQVSSWGTMWRRLARAPFTPLPVDDTGQGDEDDAETGKPERRTYNLITNNCAHTTLAMMHLCGVIDAPPSRFFPLLPTPENVFKLAIVAKRRRQPIAGLPVPEVSGDSLIRLAEPPEDSAEDGPDRADATAANPDSIASDMGPQVESTVDEGLPFDPGTLYAELGDLAQVFREQARLDGQTHQLELDVIAELRLCIDVYRYGLAAPSSGNEKDAITWEDLGQLTSPELANIISCYRGFCIEGFLDAEHPLRQLLKRLPELDTHERDAEQSQAHQKLCAPLAGLLSPNSTKTPAYLTARHIDHLRLMNQCRSIGPDFQQPLSAVLFRAQGLIERCDQHTPSTTPESRNPWQILRRNCDSLRTLLTNHLGALSLSTSNNIEVRLCELENLRQHLEDWDDDGTAPIPVDPGNLDPRDDEYTRAYQQFNDLCSEVKLVIARAERLPSLAYRQQVAQILDHLADTDHSPAVLDLTRRQALFERILEVLYTQDLDATTVMKRIHSLYGERLHQLDGRDHQLIAHLLKQLFHRRLGYYITKSLAHEHLESLVKSADGRANIEDITKGELRRDLHINLTAKMLGLLAEACKVDSDYDQEDKASLQNIYDTLRGHLEGNDVLYVSEPSNQDPLYFDLKGALSQYLTLLRTELRAALYRRQPTEASALRSRIAKLSNLALLARLAAAECYRDYRKACIRAADEQAGGLGTTQGGSESSATIPSAAAKLFEQEADDDFDRATAAIQKSAQAYQVREQDIFSQYTTHRQLFLQQLWRMLLFAGITTGIIEGTLAYLQVHWLSHGQEADLAELLGADIEDTPFGLGEVATETLLLALMGAGLWYVGACLLASATYDPHVDDRNCRMGCLDYLGKLI